jgi:hypothetical protein
MPPQRRFPAVGGISSRSVDLVADRPELPRTLETVQLRLAAQQRFDSPAQFRVAATGLAQEIRLPASS